MEIPVSELIVRYMERLGIKAIFGMPGAHILPVYDSLYNSPIQSVLAKHEQGAAFMAGGYSRTSGNISACITTAGPGATNLVTGIANAYADKLPVLCITGEAPTYIFGKGGLQESSGEGGAIDQIALFKSITVYQKLIERTDYLANVLNQTSRALLSSAPGPVLLSVPYNVQKELVDETILNEVKTSASSFPDSFKNSEHQINALATLIAEAQQPVIIAGYGCIKANAQAELMNLSEEMNIPVTTSLKGKGAISEQSDLSLGCLGVTTRGYAHQYILKHADLVIFLGASFNERTSYVWNDKLLSRKKIAQVDINPNQIERVFQADIAIEGNIKTVLNDLTNTLNTNDIKPKILQDVDFNKIKEAKQAHNEASTVFGSGFELIETLFRKMEDDLPENCMIFDDNIIFAQNFYHVTGDTHYYPNSGVSSLGHAIPAAIGARFAYDRPVVSIIGDGGFQMCCMEIMTAVNYQLPLTIILFNNDSMGLIRKNQLQQYNERFIDCDFTNPDYEQLARSFGIDYHQVKSSGDLDNIFDKIQEKSILIDVIIDKDAFPNYRSNR
jgi:acetolactate synthase-1/2/3 large subunit